MLLEWLHTPAAGSFFYFLIWLRWRVIDCQGDEPPAPSIMWSEPHIKTSYVFNVRSGCIRHFFGVFYTLLSPCSNLDNTWKIFAHKLLTYKSAFGERVHFFASSTNVESENAQLFISRSSRLSSDSSNRRRWSFLVILVAPGPYSTSTVMVMTQQVSPLSCRWWTLCINKFRLRLALVHGNSKATLIMPPSSSSSPPRNETFSTGSRDEIKRDACVLFTAARHWALTI